MHWRHAGLIGTALGLLGLAAASCGGDGLFSPEGRSRATMSTSGAVAVSGDRLALIHSNSGGGVDMFQIAVAPPTPSLDPDQRVVWQVQIARYARRPMPGTYQITPLSAGSTEPAATFFYTSEGTLELFGATSGEIVITSSSPTSVRGTFTFFATSATNETRSVTVQGSFTAVCPAGATCL